MKWIFGFVLGAGMAMAGERFELGDVFELEYASDPQVSAAGDEVVYVRNFMDKLVDRKRSSLWRVGLDGSAHRPVTAGDGNEWSPRFSPDGGRLLYLSAAPGGGATQVYVRWLESGDVARVSSLEKAPGNVVWSPDGEWIALTMFVKTKSEPMVTLPAKPEGAEWAAEATVIEDVLYRADGKGYLEDGNVQLFVLPAEGGTARQLTEGEFDVSGPLSWSRDGRAILFSSNRRDGWEFEPENSEVYEVGVVSGEVRALTARDGEDRGAVVSPGGELVAYVGFDDGKKGYQPSRLYVMGRNGGDVRVLTGGFDRSVGSPVWSADGGWIYFQYDERGETKVGRVAAGGGGVEEVVSGLGGTTLGRPYASGGFVLTGDGGVVATMGGVGRPADLHYVKADELKRLTELNEDLLGTKVLGEVSEVNFKSSHDGREVQGWVVKPPGFEEGKRYPLLLEIHGGPFLNYGPRFSAEVQLYAAAGYVVLYVNPRGSTSYGAAFGNEIHHAYPGNDYDDLMSGVDAVLEMGFVDEERLYVTGGSGGGTLTAWIVGKTDRFAAAVSAKPVIHWTSFALTADFYNYFYQYWFPGPPWEHQEQYWERSPLSLVGNVSTPTMLLTGEVDYRRRSRSRSNFTRR